MERHLRELMETGIVRGGWTSDEVVADAWARYQRTRDTAARNEPAAYTGTAAAGATAGERGDGERWVGRKAAL